MQQSIRMAAIVALVVASGCSRNHPNEERGAIIGAAAGGTVGLIAGSVKGALIGAAIGGGAGAIIGHQMDQQAKEIRRDVRGVKVSRVSEGLAVTFPSGLLFAENSDDLQEPARRNLEAFAQNLERHPNTDILIVGFTDNVGAAGYNEGLSARRAAAAENFLVEHGVRRSRIKAIGKGEAEPVASNDTEEGRRENRRVEVAIYADAAARERARRAGQ